MPELTIHQTIYLEVCRGLLSDPHFQPTPLELLAKAGPFVEAIFAALPK